MSPSLDVTDAKCFLLGSLHLGLAKNMTIYHETLHNMMSRIVRMSVAVSTKVKVICSAMQVHPMCAPV